MGQHHFAKCWTDPNLDLDNPLLDSSIMSISSGRQNEFQICKKGQIQDQKIEIEMFITARIDDYDFLDNLDTVYFSLEIGESYERDKFKWTVKGQGLEEEMRKTLSFPFKMNHVKQTVKFVCTHIKLIDQGRDDWKLC